MVVFADARAGKLHRTSLRAFLQEREIWRATSVNDRGLAILACQGDEAAGPRTSGNQAS
jgi:hypothetical protein